jgi:hypothetical protein
MQETYYDSIVCFSKVLDYAFVRVKFCNLSSIYE